MNNKEKSEKLYDAITGIREDIITGAENDTAKRTGARSKRLWIIAAAAALALIIAGGAIVMPLIGKGKTPQNSEIILPPCAITMAQYPKMAQYPDESKYIGADGEFDSDGFDEVYKEWMADIKAQRRDKGYADGLGNFFADSTRLALTEDGGNGNPIYSPLNMYMAMAMLAETADGNSRQQILDALGCKDIGALRKQASDVWNATYRDDGAVSSVLANSVWMRGDMDYNADTIERLAGTYYASAYRGEMGSDEYNKALRDWVNSQTGGLLEQQADSLELPPETILAIASTVYFRSKWKIEYNADLTVPGVFHAKSGDTEAMFMPMSDTAEYFWDDSFSAVYRQLESGGKMWFILPDEGVDPRTVLEEGRYLSLTTDSANWENKKTLVVNSKVPKFDISSSSELSGVISELGVTDVFDPAKADFSPVSEDTQGVYLSSIQHGARVAIDEEGIIAAAYTLMIECGAAMPPDEEVDFVADRPFLFVITNQDGLPMFVGVVNDVA